MTLRGRSVGPGRHRIVGVSGYAGRMEFAEVFVADGPRPELAEEMALFAPLTGSWALRVFNYEDGGNVREVSAEWHFSWALDGRAVADVWISPSRADRGDDRSGEWGLSLR